MKNEATDACSGKACVDCPYKLTSAKGWLGGNDLKIYAEAINFDILLPCHRQMNKKVRRYCSGLAAVRVNTLDYTGVLTNVTDLTIGWK